MASVELKIAFIDDMTLAEAMELKSKLILNPDPCPQLPLAYHERTGHVLPDSEYQMTEQLRKLCEYSNQNQMVINGGESKVMLFNTRKIYDFMPKLSIDETSYLEVVEECQLLGVKIRSDLRCVITLTAYAAKDIKDCG